MKKKGFTLIELIAVLVIMAIIALIVTPLVMSIIRKAKISARKRSIDAYGRSVELAIATYLLDNGTFPTDLSSLTVEYSGSEVVCSVMAMKENGGLYLSECKVNNVDVKDSSTEDGWYHYNEKDYTSEEYISMYINSLNKSLKDYYNKNGKYPNDISVLKINYRGKKILCDSIINYDGSLYLKNFVIGGVKINKEYGVDKSTAIKALLSNSNSYSVNDYNDGNKKELYTFSHLSTYQTESMIDYRYIGNNPNNYVYFNGDELWRIIGIFYVENEFGEMEQRVKILRNSKLSDDYAWNSRGNNFWGNSTLNTYLNGEYYNSLVDESKLMIVPTKFYLGASGVNTATHFGTGENMYGWERGNRTYSNLPINSVGKIALMYPSDYVYTYSLGVSSACFNDVNNCNTNSRTANSWIIDENNYKSQWLISPYLGAYNCAFSIGTYGGLSSYGDIKYGNGISPTLYLSSQVKITSGDGSEQNPYQLSM